MHNATLTAITIFGIVLASIEPAAAQARRAYRVEELGTLGGGSLVGTAMNGNGDVAGYGTLPDGTLHAFRWTAEGGLEDLGANGGRQSQAFGINDQGDVVGIYFDQNYGQHGFIARRGEVMKDLETFHAQNLWARAINNAGAISGSTPSGHAFRTDAAGGVQQIGRYLSSGDAINQNGDVTGWWLRLGSPVHTAFRFTDAAGYVDLGTLGGNRSGGYSINKHGVIVGWSEISPFTQRAHAFRARPGLPMEDLGGLPGGFAGGVSTALGINDAGDIVGSSDDPYGWTAFLYTDAEGMIELRSALPISARTSGQLYSGAAINNAGQILAIHSTPAGVRSWRLTPLQDPPVPTIFHLSVTPEVLTPPDHRMVSVSVNAAATDEYDSGPVCRIASVVNSEAPLSGPDPDVEFTHLLSVNLRATRLGTGEGRTYTLNVACSNYFGGTTTARAVVRVPHDNR